MKFIKSPALTGLFILGMIFGATACTSNYQKVSTKPVVKVNDHVLSTKEFSNQLARKLKDLDALTAKDPNTVQRTKEEILRAFIVKSLTLDWARANSLVVTESDLDKEVDKYRANYPDDLSFRRLLAQENLSFSEWREELRYTLIERAVFKKLNERIKPLTEAEIKQYYEEHKEQFKKKERIYLRQIVTDELGKADLLKSQVKQKDFAELAKKYSIAPEAKNGGLVGWIEIGSVDFFDPLFKSGVGSVTQIKSPFGFHVVKIEKKAPAATLPLEEVRNQIIRALTAQREQGEFVKWLDAQLRSSKVLKDNELINSIVVETRTDND
ncbi:peptidyl-prolyl cis-trans isomerase [Bdellovibrio sp. HCB337]|uniref:peptidylprolyl isomerase n=1 Tax=Bdellovibrio sp. HCB337 TaxID=3394358 RepID=UPI0039A594C8